MTTYLFAIKGKLFLDHILRKHLAIFSVPTVIVAIIPGREFLGNFQYQIRSFQIQPERTLKRFQRTSFGFVIPGSRMIPETAVFMLLNKYKPSISGILNELYELRKLVSPQHTATTQMVYSPTNDNPFLALVILNSHIRDANAPLNDKQPKGTNFSYFIHNSIE